MSPLRCSVIAFVVVGFATQAAAIQTKVPTDAKPMTALEAFRWRQQHKDSDDDFDLASGLPKIQDSGVSLLKETDSTNAENPKKTATVYSEAASDTTTAAQDTTAAPDAAADTTTAAPDKEQGATIENQHIEGTDFVWKTLATNEPTKCNAFDDNKLFSKEGLKDEAHCKALCGEKCKAVFFITQYGQNNCQAFKECEETSQGQWSGDLFIKADPSEADTSSSVDNANVLKAEVTGRTAANATVATHVGVAGSGECPCIGISGMPGSIDLVLGRKAQYPAEVGSACQAWDDDRFPRACEHGGKPGKGKEWCAAKWCYVDPCNCNVPNQKATYIEGSKFHGKALHFSYATCGSGNSEEYPGIDAKTGKLAKVANVALLQTDPQPNPSKKVQKKSASSEAKVSVNPFQKPSKKQVKKEIIVAGSKLKAVPKAVPKTSSEHTMAHAQNLHARMRSPDSDDDEALSTEQEEDVDVAEDTADTTESVCAVVSDPKTDGKAGCQCVGFSSKTTALFNINLGSGHKADYSSSMGATCSAWDEEPHPDCQVTGDDPQPDWCKAKWCYVDPCSCNEQFSKADETTGYFPKGKYMNRHLYYSYATCESEDTWTTEFQQIHACHTMLSAGDCKGACKWSNDVCVAKELAEGVCPKNEEEGLAQSYLPSWMKSLR